MYGHYFLFHADIERRFVDVLALLSFVFDEVLLCGIEFGSALLFPWSTTLFRTTVFHSAVKGLFKRALGSGWCGEGCTRMPSTSRLRMAFFGDKLVVMRILTRN